MMSGSSQPTKTEQLEAPAEVLQSCSLWQVVGYFHLLTWVPPVAALCVVLVYYVERTFVWWKHGV